MLAPGTRAAYGWPLRHSSASESTLEPKTRAATASQSNGWLSTSTKSGQIWSVKNSVSVVENRRQVDREDREELGEPVPDHDQPLGEGPARAATVPNVWKTRIPPKINTSRKNDSINTTPRPSTRQPVRSCR